MAQLTSHTLTQEYVAQRSFHVVESSIPADLTISEWRTSRAAQSRRARGGLRRFRLPF